MPREIKDPGSYDVPKGSSPFLKLEDGDNRIRIVSNPFEVKFIQISKKGEKYATKPLNTEQDEKEAIALGKQIKFKYAYLVISRKDGDVCVYEAPINAYKDIVSLGLNKEYGDVMKYDITINKEGQGLQTKYKITPSPKKTLLTEEEKALVERNSNAIDNAYEERE